MRPSQISKSAEFDSENKDKLLNLIYDNGSYFLFEPSNPAFLLRKNAGNVIDNYLWLIVKYMPSGRVEIQQDSVVRFGRIPFKITKLCLPGSVR
jgi:hypothetical protein